MDQEARDQNSAGAESKSSSWFPPYIYALIAALVLLFVISAFAFGDADYTDYLLAVVVGFFAVAMGIPCLLWITWRHHTNRNSADSKILLRDWLRREYETWQGNLSGWDALVQVLLPIAAVAVGMLAIGTALMLVEHSMV